MRTKKQRSCWTSGKKRTRMMSQMRRRKRRRHSQSLNCSMLNLKNCSSWTRWMRKKMHSSRRRWCYSQ
jgi:hypothetical protein